MLAAIVLRKGAGIYVHWYVDRRQPIGHIISRAMAKHIQFPRFDQSRRFFEDFAYEVAKYDDHQRTLR